MNIRGFNAITAQVYVMAETCSSSIYIRKGAIILKQTELYTFIARKMDDFQLSLHLHNIFHLIR